MADTPATDPRMAAITGAVRRRKQRSNWVQSFCSQSQDPIERFAAEFNMKHSSVHKRLERYIGAGE
jgi:hypothetical protein